MVNALANGIWKKALKTAVSSVTAVFIVNFADPQTVLYTWQWWRHLLFGALTLLILNEAKYWKDWADSNGNGNGKPMPNPVLSSPQPSEAQTKGKSPQDLSFLK